MFHKMHGRVAGMQSVQVGSAAMMLFTAITKAGSTEPDAVVRALETVDVRTPIGPLKFPAGRAASALASVPRSLRGGQASQVRCAVRAAGRRGISGGEIPA
jgi:hypothetical protein